jgi:hypothetical protein
MFVKMFESEDSTLGLRTPLPVYGLNFGSKGFTSFLRAQQGNGGPYWNLQETSHQYKEKGRWLLSGFEYSCTSFVFNLNQD